MPVTRTFVTRTFLLRHIRIEDAESWVKRILTGDAQAKVSTDPATNSITVTASEERLKRVIELISTYDWEEPMIRKGNASGSDKIDYARSDVTSTARAFFHACALEDYGAVESLLDLRTLAALRSDADAKKAIELHGQINFTPDEVKKLRAEPGNMMPENPRAEWDALAEILYGDWPGKNDKLKAMVEAWNRHPLVPLAIRPGIIAAGVSGPAYFLNAVFEGAPEPSYVITIVPRAIWSDEPERYEFSSMPPWWKPGSDTPAKSKPSPVAATGAVLRVNTDGKRATIEAQVNAGEELLVFVGDESLGSASSEPEAAAVTATVEASAELRLDDGSLGKGFIIRTPNGIAHVAITPDGPVPFGELIFRDDSKVSSKDGIFTFADISKPDGTLVPVSVRVRVQPPNK